jgi:hypothetical protein
MQALGGHHSLEAVRKAQKPGALHISILATDILKHEIEIVMVLPKLLA